jgi:GTPase SAR1 family protein
MEDRGGGAPDVSKPFTSGVRSMEATHKPLLVLRAKVVVVGDAHVGKTAMIKMFHSGGSEFPKKYIMTSWVDFNVSVSTPTAAIAQPFTPVYYDKLG